MRVRISYDADASRYTYGRKLGDAPIAGTGYEGGYSSMTKTADYKVGALVNLSWILNGPGA